MNDDISLLDQSSSGSWFNAILGGALTLLFLVVGYIGYKKYNETNKDLYSSLLSKNKGTYDDDPLLFSNKKSSVFYFNSDSNTPYQRF